MPGRYEREQADLPRVVIVGGGFGGVRAAHALRHAPVRVTVIDRNNHHVFQPLLYQVATADLSPADISAPIRGMLRDQRNAEMLLAEVVGVDVDGAAGHRARPLRGTRVHLPYDYLIVATGAGPELLRPRRVGARRPQPEVAHRRHRDPPPHTCSPSRRRNWSRIADVRSAWLTFVVVGGGPTGVELAARHRRARAPRAGGRLPPHRSRRWRASSSSRRRHACSTPSHNRWRMTPRAT